MYDGVGVNHKWHDQTEQAKFKESQKLKKKLEKEKQEKFDHGRLEALTGDTDDSVEKLYRKNMRRLKFLNELDSVPGIV